MGSGGYAIENGVGDHGIVDIGVPIIERQLAGKQDGSCAGSSIDDVEQILLAAFSHRRETEIVEDEQIEARQSSSSFADRSILMGDGQIFEELISPSIANS